MKAGRKPLNIPANPSKTYTNEWKGYGDWLGTGYIANQKREYLSFKEAKDFVKKLGIQNQDEWKKYCKLGKKPQNIPNKPDRVYEKEWISWGDWLGTGRIANQVKGWSIEKVKELLGTLIDSRAIYEWDEAVLYSLLLRKGLLNLQDSNKHRQFFKNLIEASKIEEGRKVIKGYANSDLKRPPDLLSLQSTSKQEAEEEIQKASSQDLAHLIESTEPLDYGRPKTAEQVLANTNILESINVDEEAYLLGLTRQAYLFL